MSTQKLKIFFILVSVGFICSFTSVEAQIPDNSEFVGLKKTIEGRTLPHFRFYTAADSILFTDAQLDHTKPILFFYFSTKCPYCQELTKELTQQIDSLKGIQIVMVSGHRRQSIAKYSEMFDLKKYPITVLKDDEKHMHEYFDYAAVPMLRLYDKNKNLIHRQEGRLTVATILALFREHSAL